MGWRALVWGWLMVTMMATPLAQAAPRTLLVLGDSLSAAYGLAIEEGWVHRLERRLQERGEAWTVVNASISGDTSAGGLSRLPAALAQHRPALVLLELGANDGLRGQSLEVLSANLHSMIDLSREAGAQVVLVGMRIPPNYGPLYARKFQQLYPEVAARAGVPLVPFLLDGVAGVPGLMQDDRLHPAASAQPRMLDNVWTVLEPVLDALR